MKYNEGDRVRIKSIDWYNENKNEDGDVPCEEYDFVSHMSVFCGKTLTIDTAFDDETYFMEEDDKGFVFTNEMIEGLVEEEIGSIDNPFSRWANEFNLPDGYQFKDENGNVINATKIVLEKKENEYPNSYSKCCDILGCPFLYSMNTHRHAKELQSLYMLLICRDAYWKIAGEEMGLGKPWKLSIGTPIYYIYYNKTVSTIKNDYADDIQGNVILAFPTEEMRDAFYENFKELIEQCKELL